MSIGHQKEEEDKGDDEMFETMIVFTKMVDGVEIIDSVTIDGVVTDVGWEGEIFCEIEEEIAKVFYVSDGEPTITDQLISHAYRREENLLKH